MKQEIQKNRLLLRKQALWVLQQVLGHGSFLEDALSQLPPQLVARDRAWIYDITSGVLRWKGTLDWILKQLVKKKAPTGDLQKSLWIAAYQILEHDRVEPKRVISETIDWLKQTKGESVGRFAAAVLNQLAQPAELEQWRQVRPLSHQAVDEQAQMLSLPTWIWARWVKAYGWEPALKLALAARERPVIGLAVQSSVQAEFEQWAGDRKIRIESFVATPAFAGYRLLGVEAQREAGAGWLEPLLDRFAEKAWVQDPGSQALVHWVHAQLLQLRERGEAPLLLSSSGARILDLCAAPGGKSIGLAVSGWKMRATDVQKARWDRLQENVHRLRLEEQVDTVSYEQRYQGALAAIWLDAPCTGVGTLSKTPEIRWQKTEKQLTELCRLQGELAQEAWDQLPTGGILIYSVCSNLPDEGMQQVALWEKKWQNARKIGIWASLQDGQEGLWAALLQKT